MIPVIFTHFFQSHTLSLPSQSVHIYKLIQKYDSPDFRDRIHDKLHVYIITVLIDPHTCSADQLCSYGHGMHFNKPYFFNRKEAKDHGEGGSLVGYRPKDGDRILIIEDVITAGTAIRETMPILTGCGQVTVPDMFISVNRCEVGQTPGKTAVMEVGEAYGIQVHALVTVRDIHEYLKAQPTYADVLPRMEAYMRQYCVLD